VRMNIPERGKAGVLGPSGAMSQPRGGSRNVLVVEFTVP
jgi:hypothetical protein